jgi:hypothetical protein
VSGCAAEGPVNFGPHQKTRPLFALLWLVDHVEEKNEVDRSSAEGAGQLQISQKKSGGLLRIDNWNRVGSETFALPVSFGPHQKNGAYQRCAVLGRRLP